MSYSVVFLLFSVSELFLWSLLRCYEPGSEGGKREPPAEEAEPGFFLMACNDAVLARWHLINLTLSENVDVIRGWSDSLFVRLCVSCRISRKPSTEPRTKHPLLLSSLLSKPLPLSAGSSGKTVNCVNISRTQGDGFLSLSPREELFVTNDTGQSSAVIWTGFGSRSLR